MSRVLVGAAALALSVGNVAQAGVITVVGDVQPAGVGPGDTTLSAQLEVGISAAGSVTVDEAILGAAFTRIGANTGGDGTVLVTGTGAELRSAGAAIGDQGSGRGTLSIVQGGRLVMTSTGSAGFTVGANSALSQGSVEVSGAGSEIAITGNAGAPGVTVGRLGEGGLAVTGGGRIAIDGGNTAAGGMGIGGGVGLGAAAANANGSVLVSGAGSAISMTAAQRSQLTVGAFGTGELTIEEQGAVSLVGGMSIARVGGTGTVTVRSGGSLTALPGSIQNGGSGAVIVGGVGDAELNVDNGTVAITAANNAIGGMTIGGNTAADAGGTGDVTVAGATGRLRIDGGNGFLDVGRFGTGTLEIRDGGAVALAGQSGTVRIGVNAATATTPLGDGSVTVGAGSSLSAASFIGVGIGNDHVSDGGKGILLLEGGSVSAPELRVGSAGTIAGIGTIDGNLTLAGGALDPGSSPGTLAVSGDFTLSSGSLTIEIGGAGTGAFDLLAVGGTARLLGGTVLIDFLGGFLPGSSDSLLFLSAADLVVENVVFAFADPEGAAYRVDTAADGLRLVSAQAVPGPGTLALIAPMLGLLLVRRRAH